MNIKDDLITLLETLGYPVFLQGSVNGVDDYPNSFFTVWNFETPEGAYYDNDANRAVWGFWIYFYSIDPDLVFTEPEKARQLLKVNDWTLQGKANDISVDKPTHTGAFFTALKVEQYVETTPATAETTPAETTPAETTPAGTDTTDSDTTDSDTTTPAGTDTDSAETDTDLNNP